MAIAYFIPDQTKLLAAGNSNGQGNHHQQQQQQPTSGAAPGGTPPSDNDGNNNSAYQQQQQTQNHNFRANITIPLAAYASTAPENVGCWDLITQVFCYALRFCHETRLSPAVIEISFEFNGGLQQQANSTSTNGNTVQAAVTNIAAATATAVPPTTPSNSAVGNTTTTRIHANTPQTSVAATATTRLDDLPNVTAARQNDGRGSGRQTHRTNGRRSGAVSRRN